MKHLYRFIFAIFIITGVIACKEEDDFSFLPQTPSFTITSPADNASLILDSSTDGNNPGLIVTWEDTANTGATYTVQMATDEAFTTPVDLGSASGPSFTMSVEAINAALLNADIPAYAETTIYLRVTTGSMTTDTIKLVVSSYPENPPVITSPDSTFEVVLSDVTEDEVALTVTWEDQDFSENSTVTVDYAVEVALAGTDFVTVATLGNTQDLTLETIHSALNDAALELGLAVDTAAALDLRVKASLETATGTLDRFSEMITITVTPYETALPPILYGVGAGLPDAGWGWDTPVELPLQGTKYSGNVNLSPDNGGNFRFFTENGNWGSGQNYPWYTDRGYTIDSNLVDAQDGDNNFLFTGTAGQYFIEIDTEAKTITLGAPQGANCEFDALWLVGAGIPDAGWGWGSPVEFPCTGSGVYSANVTFSNDSFRFFTENGNWGSGRNFPYYADQGYTIDSNFENAMDGDSNFRFVGTPGEYLLTLDTINKTITLGPPMGPSCEFDALWIVGAGVPDAGWGWGSPIEFACTGAGVYSADVNFTNDAFRFFTENGNWGSGRNFPYYADQGYTIDSNFENAMDGDSNFRFVGTPGTYTLTMDTVAKTITLQAPQASCEFDSLWIVGAGVPAAGWAWDSPVEFACTGNGVYSASITFANDAFRFFTENGNWGSGRNYPFYADDGYTIDSNFENAMDGDSNFRFVGTPGTYTLIMDTVNKTITLQ